MHWMIYHALRVLLRENSVATNVGWCDIFWAYHPRLLVAYILVLCIWLFWAADTILHY
jgi:hypothetical protein